MHHTCLIYKRFSTIKTIVFYWLHWKRETSFTSALFDNVYYRRFGKVFLYKHIRYNLVDIKCLVIYIITSPFFFIVIVLFWLIHLYLITLGKLLLLLFFDSAFLWLNMSLGTLHYIRGFQVSFLLIRLELIRMSFSSCIQLVNYQICLL